MRQVVYESETKMVLKNVDASKKIYAFIKDGIIYQFKSDLWVIGRSKYDSASAFQAFMPGNHKYRDQYTCVSTAINAKETVFEFDSQIRILKMGYFSSSM